MAKAQKNKEEGVESLSPLDKAMKALEAKFGKGTVMLANSVNRDLEVVSTGSIALDIATGINGYPIGVLIEFLGMESSGKSTGSIHAIKEFQKLPGKQVLVNAEDAFDPKYAEKIGVDLSRLIVLQPSCSEDAYNQIEILIRTGEIRLVVIDSHTSLMPKVVVDGEVGQATIGLQARINSIALGKIKPLLRANRCTMLALSQIRQAIASMGETNISTGGLAYRFYSDMRIKFAKIKTDKEDEVSVTEVSVVKNKCAPPWGKAVFNIQWGKGFDYMQEIIDYATELGYIKVGGAWYTIGESTKVQGSEKVKEFFNDNPEYYTQLCMDVLEKIKG